MKCNTIISLQRKKVLADLNHFCLLFKTFQRLCNLANEKQIVTEQTKKFDDILSIFSFFHRQKPAMPHKPEWKTMHVPCT